jgi:hypothetical protein
VHTVVAVVPGAAAAAAAASAGAQRGYAVDAGCAVAAHTDKVGGGNAPGSGTGLVVQQNNASACCAACRALGDATFAHPLCVPCGVNYLSSFAGDTHRQRLGFVCGFGDRCCTYSVASQPTVSGCTIRQFTNHEARAVANCIFSIRARRRISCRAIRLGYCSQKKL